MMLLGATKETSGMKWVKWKILKSLTSFFVQCFSSPDSIRQKIHLNVLLEMEYYRVEETVLDYKKK